MSYALDITPEAGEDLARLPIAVANQVETELLRLARSPTRLSQPSTFPYPNNTQAFKVEIEFEGTHYFFHVLFHYGQDEQTLHIDGIAVRTI